jgi:hypothetical protein
MTFLEGFVTGFITFPAMVLVVIAIMIIRLVKADREGLFPTDHLREVTEDDGGTGPL